MSTGVLLFYHHIFNHQIKIKDKKNVLQQSECRRLTSAAWRRTAEVSSLPCGTLDGISSCSRCSPTRVTRRRAGCFYACGGRNTSRLQRPSRLLAAAEPGRLPLGHRPCLSGRRQPSSLGARAKPGTALPVFKTQYILRGLRAPLFTVEYTGTRLGPAIQQAHGARVGIFPIVPRALTDKTKPHGNFHNCSALYGRSPPPGYLIIRRI